MDPPGCDSWLPLIRGARGRRKSGRAAGAGEQRREGMSELYPRERVGGMEREPVGREQAELDGDRHVAATVLWDLRGVRKRQRRSRARLGFDAESGRSDERDGGGKAID